MSSAMEDQRKTVIGYPVQFPHGQSGYQLSNYSVAQPTYPATNTNHRAVGAHHVLQLSPDLVEVSPRQSRILGYCIIISLLAILVTFIVYSIVISTTNNYNPPEFQLNSASVSSFNLSDSQITTNWNISFLVRNPDKTMNISYDMMEASVLYKDQILSSGTISPFYQATMEQTLVQASLTSSANDWVTNSILEEWSALGVVDFNLEVQALVRLQPETPLAKGWVRVSCKDINMEFSSETMHGGSRRCKTVIQDIYGDQYSDSKAF